MNKKIAIVIILWAICWFSIGHITGMQRERQIKNTSRIELVTLENEFHTAMKQAEMGKPYNFFIFNSQFEVYPISKNLFHYKRGKK